MGIIKDLVLLTAIGYSAFATYTIMQKPEIMFQECVHESVHQDSFEQSDSLQDPRLLGRFSYHNTQYPVYQGPVGPRLGTIDYVASNLYHDEKVLMTEKVLSYLPDVAGRAATDIWENRQAIIDDVSSKIRGILRGDQ